MSRCSRLRRDSAADVHAGRGNVLWHAATATAHLPDLDSSRLYEPGARILVHLPGNQGTRPPEVWHASVHAVDVWHVGLVLRDQLGPCACGGGLQCLA